MADLLCTEADDLCFDDLDSDGKIHLDYDEKNMGFVEEESEVSFDLMVQGESEHLPRNDYLRRLRSGDLDLSIRREAIDWICKAHAHYGFGALSLCLSVNYLDRFLSIYELPIGKAWAVQFLAVACLSLATKVVEIKVPAIVDLQVGDPKFVFDAKAIKRMELLVMNTLNWRMQASTPFTFIEYFLGKFNNGQIPSGKQLISKSIQHILSTIRGIDFLEFKPSEIAAAVAMCVSREIQAIDIEKATTSCFIKVEKGKVMKCVEMIQDLTLVSAGGASNSGNTTNIVRSIPQSPVGVLEAGTCLSYKSSDDGRTVGSCPNSSQNSPHQNTKRRKLDIPIPTPTPSSSQGDFMS